MTKPVRIILIIISSLLLLLTVGYFIAESVVTSKIKDALDNQLPSTMKLDYDQVDVSLWNGKVEITNVNLENVGAHTSEVNAVLSSDAFLVDGFGYWNYFKNKNISLNNVSLKNPKLEYFHDKRIPDSAYANSSPTKLKNRITIAHFNIDNAALLIKNTASDSVIMSVRNIDAQLENIAINERSLQRKIPLEYDDFELSFTDFMYDTELYEKIKINSVHIDRQSVSVDSLQLFTKYSKPQFDRMLTVERDHFDLVIPGIELKDYDFGFRNDSLFYFQTPEIALASPQFKIYRNKLIADDLTRKPMYSSMLRNLGLDLSVDQVSITDASIAYSEKVNADMPAGVISFHKLNADIKNVGNTYGKSQTTKLDIDAVFMKSTPIIVNWDFDVHNVNDAFVFKANIGRLPAADLNAFSQPNLKVLLEGELIQTFATISGDANTSRVNMRINYDEFKIGILDKEGEKKKKILSALANLFIKKTSNKAEDGFRESFKENIERDKTKSIFNFFWMNLRDGLVSVMTGNGKQ